MSWSMAKTRSKILITLTGVLFFVICLLFWGVFYPDHLVQKEQMQMFLWGLDYLQEHLAFQGGFSMYLGEFLIQFFCFPWVGALVVGSILFLLYFLMQFILSKLFSNRFYVLSFLPAIGYCFLLFNDYYTISGALSVALSLAGVVWYIRIENTKARILAGFIMLMVFYWLLGGAYLLFVSSAAASEFVRVFRTPGKRTSQAYWVVSGYLFFGGLIPLIVHRFLVVDTFLQCYFSPAYYQFRLVFPGFLVLMFVAPAMLIFLQWIIDSLLSEKSGWTLQVGLSILLIGFCGYGFYFFPDWHEETEMKYDNLVYRKDWNEIIRQARQNQPSGQKSRVALMLALGQTGQLSSQLFLFDPRPSDFFIPYEVRGMAPIIANEPYYWLGLINFSQMLAMESIESTPDGKMPVRAVKRYAETCMITGQYQVASRFLRLLQKTLFYRHWANAAMEYLNQDDKVDAHPEWGVLRRRQVKDDFYFKFDQCDLALTCLLRSDPANRLAFEYRVSSSLLKKDLDEFLEFLPLVRNMDYPQFPLVFQEALAYIETLLPQMPADLLQYPVDDQVHQRLTRYAGLFNQGGNKDAGLMKPDFGNTYWYYVHFSGNDEK